MDCSYLKQGVMRSVSNKDAIRLWHIWWWFHWAGFINQTTMIAITWGTKNEGTWQGTRNTAQIAKLLLVQINKQVT